MVIEWLCILVLLLVLVVALATALPGVSSKITCGFEQQIAAVSGGTAGCADAERRRARTAPPPRQTPFGAPDRPRTAGPANKMPKPNGPRYGGTPTAARFGPNAIASRRSRVVDDSRRRYEGAVKSNVSGTASAERLYREWRLGEVDPTVKELERKLGLAPKAKAAKLTRARAGARLALRGIREATSKGSIALFLADFLINATPTSCKADGLSRRFHVPAGRVFVAAAAAVRDGGEDRVKTDKALRDLYDTRDAYQRQLDSYGGSVCGQEIAAGLEVTKRLIRTVNALEAVVDARLFPDVPSDVETLRNNGGSIRYAALDARDRATAVRARLTRTAINQGTSCTTDPPGYRSGSDNRSHLVARVLGARGVRTNCVATSDDFNQKTMRVPERMAVRDLRRGISLIYESIPEYAPGRLRPVAVHIRITQVGTDPKGRNVVVYDKRLTGTG